MPPMLFRVSLLFVLLGHFTVPDRGLLDQPLTLTGDTLAFTFFFQPYDP